MNDNLTGYRAFICVADSLSFTKAARMLGFSQSSVSRMVLALEREHGVQLLERSRAGVCLTSEGEALLPAARSLVAAQDDFAAQVSGIKGVETGHVRIGTFSSVATHWLPKVIDKLMADNSSITYELLLGDYGEIEEWTASGRVDCGFTRLPAARGLHEEFLADDELMAILPPNHSLASLDAVPSELLKKERFLLLEKNDNTVVGEAFALCGGTPRSAVTVWDDYAIMAMVESGLGVSVLPSLILQRIPYDIAVRPLERPVYRAIGLVTRNAAKRSGAMRRFTDCLGEWLQQSPSLG